MQKTIKDAILRSHLIDIVTKDVSNAVNGGQFSELYLSGSGASYVSYKMGHIDIPIKRIPTDLDFASSAKKAVLYEANNYQEKLLETFVNIAQNNNGILVTENNSPFSLRLKPYRFKIQKEFTAEEQNEIMQSRKDTVSEVTDAPYKVSLPIQLVPASMHTLTPQKYFNDLLPLANPVETLAFKIARSMNPERDSSTDLVDIYNLTHANPSAIDLNGRDNNVVRIVSFVKMADSLGIESSDICFDQLAPTQKNIQKTKEQLKGSVFTEEMNLKASAVEALLTAAHDTVIRIYGTDDPTKLHEFEKEFLDSIASPKFTIKDKNIRVDLLAEIYPEEFNAHPEMAGNILKNDFIRDRMGTLGR